MHKKLSQALNLLDIETMILRDDEGKEIRTISAKEHADALFTYLNLAGYLSPDLLQLAIEYLSLEKPFSCSNELILNHFKTTCDIANTGEKFNVSSFLENFCHLDDLTVDDIIDLVVFLQQTAFDREFGVERDHLQAKWLEQQMKLFAQLATTLGVTTPLPPMYQSYFGTGIMGAASTRVRQRIEYFNSLKVHYGKVWALSGDRKLSKGLDEENVMSEMATVLGKPVHFLEEGEGQAKRWFLEGVTETMMVNYFLEKMCPNKEISLIDSSVEEKHWRATTAQGAKDIAEIIATMIQEGQLINSKDETLRFMIIAEQPYAGRMARQVQRAFNAEFAKKNLKTSFCVEGVGPGLSDSDFSNLAVLTRLNSELGSIMAERFYDARLKLQQNLDLHLRDPKIILFSTRKKKYLELMNSISEKQLSNRY